MKVTDLSPDDFELLMAFVEVAREECTGHHWGEIENEFKGCWRRMRSPTSPDWRDIATFVRNACTSQG